MQSRGPQSQLGAVEGTGVEWASASLVFFSSVTNHPERQRPKTTVIYSAGDLG